MKAKLSRTVLSQPQIIVPYGYKTDKTFDFERATKVRTILRPMPL